MSETYVVHLSGTHLGEAVRKNCPECGSVTVWDAEMCFCGHYFGVDMTVHLSGSTYRRESLPDLPPLVLRVSL
jgi:hypothetical protein